MRIVVQPMRAILGSVVFFVLASFVYVAMLFRAAGKRNAAIGMMSILSVTVLNPYYWMAFAITLWIGWRLAGWLAH